MEITSTYNSVYGSTYTAQQQVTKKEETSGAAAEKSSGNEDHLNQLKKLAPSVKFRIGSGLSTAKSGLTLTVNPKLLEKMQNDPEQERETMELIRGVETATKLVESFHKANGSTTVYRHGYIDENGKYWSCAYTVKKDAVNEKLRKKTQADMEKRIEKSRENARKRAEQLAERLEEMAAEKKAEKVEQKTARVEQVLNEKISASKDGMLYLNDSDFREILEAMREDNENSEEHPVIGAYLDLRA